MVSRSLNTKQPTDFKLHLKPEPLQRIWADPNSCVRLGKMIFPYIPTPGREGVINILISIYQGKTEVGGVQKERGKYVTHSEFEFRPGKQGPLERLLLLPNLGPEPTKRDVRLECSNTSGIVSDDF